MEAERLLKRVLDKFPTDTQGGTRKGLTTKKKPGLITITDILTQQSVILIVIVDADVVVQPSCCYKSYLIRQFKKNHLMPM